MQIHSRKHLITGLVLFAGLAAVLVLVHIVPLDSAAGRLYPECLLYRATGLYCGGCGGTRCVEALAHGEFRQAIAYNAVTALLLVPLYCLWVVHCFYYGFRGRPLVPWQKIPVWVYIVLFVLFVGFSVARNIPGPPFNRLAPHRLGSG